ncbi:MAG: hypothetical protein SFW07_07240 [Gammaproteobacteria bacterium]|nr:hypothetical protein [Gammaproteobacteria bacterium]
MSTKPENTNIPPKPLDTDTPVKEFFNFLFKKRIGRALGWMISKLDEYLSDETHSDGRTSRVAAQNSAEDYSVTQQLGAWAGAVASGLKMLLIPAKKLYQYYKWRKEPTRKKPVFTAVDAFYLTIDIALFALTIAAVALASSFVSVIIGFAAACVTIVSGVVEFVQSLKSTNTTNSGPLNIAKRTMSLTLPALGVAAAGLILLGTVLGPVGVPLITIGVGIGVGVTVLGIATWVAQKVDTYLIKKAHQRKIDACLLEGSFEKDTSLTLSEKISRMFEVQRFLSENVVYDDKKYQRFFKSAVLVRALSNADALEKFKVSVHDKHHEASRALLVSRPLSEKKEIPLEVIVDHVIASPSYAKTFLQKKYGTVLLGRRNFRKELSLRMDLVLKLKAAAEEDPVLAEAIVSSKLENSRHFKKHASYPPRELESVAVFSQKW